MFERIEANFIDWREEIQDSDVTTFEQYYQMWELEKELISTEDSFSNLLITGIVVVGAIYILRNKIRKSKNPIIRAMRACSKAYKNAADWTRETYQDFKDEWNAQEADDQGSTEDISRSSNAKAVHVAAAKKFLGSPLLYTRNSRLGVDNFSTVDTRHFMSDIQPQIVRNLENQLERQIEIIKASETGTSPGKLDTTNITSSLWKTNSLESTIAFGKDKLERSIKQQLEPTDAELEDLILSALHETEWTRNEYIRNIEQQHALVDRIAKYSDSLDKEFIVMAGEIRTDRVKSSIQKAVNDVAFIIEQNLKLQADIVRQQNQLMIRAFGEMMRAQALFLSTVDQSTPQGVAKFKQAKKRHDKTRDVIRKLTKILKEL